MNTYQFAVAVGDVVFLPDGHRAKVIQIDYEVGGNSKVVIVKPEYVNGIVANLLWFLSARTKYSYHDSWINMLILVKKA